MALIGYLFRRHGITPGQYYDMSPGEKLIIRAIVEHEIDVVGGVPNGRCKLNDKRQR